VLLVEAIADIAVGRQDDAASSPLGDLPAPGPAEALEMPPAKNTRR
jgi:hypothetical protein